MTSTSIEPALDPRSLRRVFGCFPSGVATVAAQIDGKPVGMVASSFVSVSLDPPLVSVCFALTSRTWPRLRSASRVGISVLANEQEALCKQMSGPETSRFENTEFETTAEGAVLIEGATAWFDCSFYEEFVAGDHTVVLFEIHAHKADTGVLPLVFHASHFRRLVER